MTKSIFLSRTAAASAVTFLCGFLPVVRDVVAENPGLALNVIGVLGLGLRLLTKSKVALYPDA